jgi:hypothetical protein
VLEPSLGTMNLSLAHRHYETFDLEWHEMGDQPAHPLGVFLPKETSQQAASGEG